MDHLQTKIENEDDEDANENDNSKKNEGGGEACEEKKVIEDARFLYNPTFSFDHSNAKRDHHVIEIEKEPEGKTEILNAVLESLPDPEPKPKPKRRRASSSGVVKTDEKKK